MDPMLEIVKELLYCSLYVRELFLGGMVSGMFGLEVMEGIAVAAVIWFFTRPGRPRFLFFDAQKEIMYIDVIVDGCP